MGIAYEKLYEFSPKSHTSEFFSELDQDAASVGLDQGKAAYQSVRFSGLLTLRK